ncbi:hypothetical protein [Paracoccus lutimaris]|uniref:hypothetical protein n=1 Tax=Paracoccus lutimaris TaxID=1490030 RepID=UPI0011C07C2A|nr:hypothetical protein [Paracoccus lutimaris]
MRREVSGQWTILSETKDNHEIRRKAGRFTTGNGLAGNDVCLWGRGPLADDPADQIGRLLHRNGDSFSAIPLPREFSHDVLRAQFVAHDICCAPDGPMCESALCAAMVVRKRLLYGPGFFTTWKKITPQQLGSKQ